ncbi:RICIN domain-containing protein [Haloferula sargassicola]
MKNNKPTVPRLFGAILSLFLLAFPADAAREPSCGIYGGGPLYKPGAAANINELANSGFSEVIVWNIAINAAGDLNFNYEFPVCQGGNYVGNSTYPDFPLHMAALKRGKVKRVTFGLGSSNIGTFQSIRDLVNSQGTGSNSILYRNFRALKDAVPSVDAIDFDDENCYDQSTMVSFAVMLGDLGYKVTLAPYVLPSFWTSVASQVNSQRPGTIDAIHLQCYDGGAGNNPANWNFGGIPVYPGLWNQTDSLSQIQTKMTNWRTSANCSGGFLWIYDGVVGNAAAYANAINTAFQNSPSGLPLYMIVNRNSGKSLDLISGNTGNGADINQWSFASDSANQRWFIVPTEGGNHVKIVSAVSGRCLCIAGDSTADGAKAHAWYYIAGNPAHQWDLIDAGNGWYEIRNVKSGKILEVQNWSTADNGRVQQWTDASATSQQWRLLPWGDYNIRTESGKYICTQGGGNTNGSQIIQYTYENNPWFKWRFDGVGNGHLKAASLHALGRVISVTNSSSSAAAPTQLWDYNPNNIGDQKLRIRPLTNGKVKFYFNHTGMAWDIPGGSTANGAPLHQYPDNGFGWQQFSLERIQ